ncbi:hypothetical protein KDN24_10310 [Bacillus sp. Bva_UNVM-123]|uniref:hypothetical protein n=1 Tax=Bacillus sp. Bva_UNVM-123 TaxID=2829798 RepID=UPI00391F2AAE
MRARINSRTLRLLKLDEGIFHEMEQEFGHPIHLFQLENRELERLIESKIRLHLDEFAKKDTVENTNQLFDDCFLLFEIDKHYLRIEKLLSPFLESYVNRVHSNKMWRHYDFIRDNLSYVMQKLIHYKGEKQTVIVLLNTILYEIREIIKSEENFLFPMALNNLKDHEWAKMAKESDMIGYCFNIPSVEWKPKGKVFSI